MTTLPRGFPGEFLDLNSVAVELLGAPVAGDMVKTVSDEVKRNPTRSLRSP